MLPFSNQRRHSQDHAGEPDPESSQLIPTRKRRHRVRVQGRLAVVRSVSTVNLRPAASVAPTLPSPVAASGTTTPATPKFESGVAGSTGTPVRRRKSLDEASSDTEEDDAKETAVRDRQFRGAADRSLRLDEIQLVIFEVCHVSSVRVIRRDRQEAMELQRTVRSEW
ncbi:UDP-glucuronosyl/UDP-glucosyltransferase [Colletotrichum tofieldiae]|nr:UDP-glucuronosyl/UDP-glucosyltransferase [Colletotrichum tofieldiae]